MYPDGDDDPRLAVQRQLEDLVGSGELTLDQFSDRSAAVWQASCPAELDTALEGLPIVGPARQPFDQPAPAIPVHSGVRAPVSYANDSPSRPTTSILGDIKRTGRWDLTHGFVCNTVLGDVYLDMREAVISAPRTAIQIKTFMGDVRVILAPTMTVTVGGNQWLGDLTVDDAEHTGGRGPHIDLTVTTVMGDVKIRHQNLATKPPVLWRWF